MEQHCGALGTSAAPTRGTQHACYLGSAQQTPVGALAAFPAHKGGMGLARETLSAARGMCSFMTRYVVATHISKVFLFATKQISRSETPLVHEVIPIFDIISRALDDHVGDGSLPSAVRVAAARGRTLLNKYYGLSDDSIVYRIAMRKSCRVPSLSASSTNSLRRSRAHIPQCCIPDTRHRISTKHHGLANGSPRRKTFCVRSGTRTTSQHPHHLMITLRSR
jgi:hypothetical protein